MLRLDVLSRRVFAFYEIDYLTRALAVDLTRLQRACALVPIYLQSVANEANAWSVQCLCVLFFVGTLLTSDLDCGQINSTSLLAIGR